MRDPIREKDIEQATGAALVEVDVADNGIAVVTIKRDDLDLLLDGNNRAHWGCRTDEDCQEAFDRGVDAGRKSALDEVRALAPKDAA